MMFSFCSQNKKRNGEIQRLLKILKCVRYCEKMREQRVCVKTPAHVPAIDPNRCTYTYTHKHTFVDYSITRSSWSLRNKQAKYANNNSNQQLLNEWLKAERSLADRITDGNKTNIILSFECWTTFVGNEGNKNDEHMQCMQL